MASKKKSPPVTGVGKKQGEVCTIAPEDGQGGEGTIGVILDGDFGDMEPIKEQVAPVLGRVSRDIHHSNAIALEKEGYRERKHPLSSFTGYDPNDPKVGEAWSLLREAWESTAKKYPLGLDCADSTIIIKSDIPVSAGPAGSRAAYEKALSAPPSVPGSGPN